MMTGGWVRWTRWTENGMTGFGMMPISEVQMNLQQFEQEAKKLMLTTGADHVLYGVKLYDKNGELDEVKFYLMPMGEEEFQEKVASIPDVTVYALHRRS